MDSFRIETDRNSAKTAHRVHNQLPMMLAHDASYFVNRIQNSRCGFAMHNADVGNPGILFKQFIQLKRSHRRVFRLSQHDVVNTRVLEHLDHSIAVCPVAENGYLSVRWYARLKHRLHSIRAAALKENDCPI